MLTNEKGKGIRLTVDEQTYSLLKSEQNDFYQAKKRKIALSDVILHYFREGYNNSNSESESGLGVIKAAKSVESVQNTVQNSVQNGQNLQQKESKELEKKAKRLELWEESLNERDRQLLYAEDRNDDKARELQLLESRLSNDQKAIQEYSNQELINSKMEMYKMKTEIDNLKEKLNPNDSFDRELKQISKQLKKIESQTKKSTLDIIMQFATPLISLIGFFQMNKKMNSSSPELGEIQKQIQTIFSKLESEEKESILDKAFKIIL